jgi:hypothetical protein
MNALADGSSDVRLAYDVYVMSAVQTSTQVV